MIAQRRLAAVELEAELAKPNQWCVGQDLKSAHGTDKTGRVSTSM